MLIKDIYSYSISISFAQLTVLIPLPLLNILPFFLSTSRIELIP